MSDDSPELSDPFAVSEPTEIIPSVDLGHLLVLIPEYSVREYDGVSTPHKT